MFWVKVYDKQFKVDPETGEGIDRILIKLDYFIIKLTRQYLKLFNYMEFDDLKQEISILALEGIKNYDKARGGLVFDYRGAGTKLSTFIHIHLNNKLITMVRADHAHKHSASFLTVEEQQGDSKRFFAKRAISLSRKMNRSDDTDHQLINELPESNTIFYSQADFEVAEFRLTLNTLLDRYYGQRRIDDITRKCIEDIYYNGMTIVDSVSLPGGRKALSEWAMSCRLKKLAPLFKDLKLKYIKDGQISPKSSFRSILYLQ